MKKALFDLPELAHELDTSVETLIRYGSTGELTIYVIADEWPGKVGTEKSAQSNIKADELVALDPSDLLKSLNADYTLVRKVHMDDGRLVVLDSPQQVMRGVHFVKANDQRRLQQILRPMQAVHGESVPAYLDPSHEYYSSTLEAAVNAWSALFKDGEFSTKTPVRDQIGTWLKANYKNLSQNARESITTVVNPDALKRGGGRQES